MQISGRSWTRTYRETVSDGFSMMTDARKVQAFLIDMLRPVHNFVASAATLIDHARILYNELYKPGNLMPSYPAKIAADFANDGISQFVKDLRNYCLHRRLPVMSGSVSMNLRQGEGEISCPIYL